MFLTFYVCTHTEFIISLRLVTLQASGIPLSLWESEWLESDKEYKNCILFTMLRMKKSLVLTAGQFAPLTLNTFVAVSTNNIL